MPELFSLSSLLSSFFFNILAPHLTCPFCATLAKVFILLPIASKLSLSALNQLDLLIHPKELPLLRDMLWISYILREFLCHSTYCQRPSLNTEFRPPSNNPFILFHLNLDLSFDSLNREILFFLVLKHLLVKRVPENHPNILR